MYATCQQLQAQAQAHAAAASALLGYAELRLHMQPSIALATRGRLQGLRLQLALLDQEFDDHDYETLRALGSDNVPNAASMSEEEINALPVHKYKTSAPQCNVSPMQQVSSSNSPQKRQDSTNPISIKKGSEDELTCSVCLEQVSVGDQQVSVSINKCRRSYLQFTLFASDSFPPPFIVYEVDFMLTASTRGCDNKVRVLFVNSGSDLYGRKSVE
ncbi:E3 ubiquitin-protein ligase SDIR1 [Hibiscus syriacus]|uniref:RING-type E3 ubiquitin transferase n=1 Tax=Hibiscus syriacus TaxID=106335 RepID=A0A6A3BSR0_HIBSY|nr:E3 ubiquitin-protein ligase SDIR1 [Hibiscus syriacus]